MARRRKNGLDEGEDGVADEQPSPAANSAMRAEIIRETCETVAEYDRQIAGIKAEKKAVIETRIVAELGMKKGDFALAYKLHEMDQSERDALHDTIREVYAAHGLGFQGNWLDAAEQTGASA